MIPDPVLLVDDEVELRLNLKEALNQDGYQVEAAPDAVTALDLIAARHYPVVITDLNMPGGPSGFQLIEAVKAVDPMTLCVVMTGYASMEAAVRALKFGAYDFIQKPFKLAEIEAVLDRALDHAAVLAQLRDYQQDLEARVVARVRELQGLHAEMFELNNLLVASQWELDEAPILGPFLEHLRVRLEPKVCLALLPTPGEGWECLGPAGGRVPAVLPGTKPLPPPARLREPLEWPGRKGTPEGYLVPLRSGDVTLGAIYLNFGERKAFQPEEPAFVMWRRQLEAALHGLRRTREVVAGHLTGARPETRA